VPFEWDETKRRTLLPQRQVDLLYAALIFEGDVLSWPDERRKYGETRTISLGLVEGEVFVVVHTQRGDVTRLITAWKGGRRDRERYQEGIARRTAGDGGSR
jgi:uncharacterized protein